METSVAEPKVNSKTAENKATQRLVYFTDAVITCACGNKFTTGSTKKEIHVEICSSCHPFFTGQEKLVDTEGRVERFQRMKNAKKEAKPKKDSDAKKPDQPKSLKEMLLALDNK